MTRALMLAILLLVISASPVPIQADGDSFGLDGPMIASIAPPEAAPWTTITIRGERLADADGVCACDVSVGAVSG